MFNRGACPGGKAFIDVAIAASGSGAGRMSRFRALIDTGATATGIAGTLAAAMELPYETTKNVRTAEGERKCPVHGASIGLLSRQGAVSKEQNIAIVALPFQGREYDVLLGMDVLSRCCFVTRGREFFLGFDGNNEETLQAAADFLLPRKRGAARA